MDSEIVFDALTLHGRDIYVINPEKPVLNRLKSSVYNERDPFFNENLNYTIENQIVLGGILASNLGAKIGDKIYLQSFSDAELSFSSSKVFSCEVVHIFFSGLHEYDKNIVYLNIETAQSILGYGSNEVNGLIIEKDDNIDLPMHNKVIMGHVKDFQNQLNNMFPESNWISIQRVLEEVIYEIDPNQKFPPDQETLDQINMLTQDQTQTLINFDEDKIRISGMLPDLSSDELDEARDSIILYTKQNFPDWLSVVVTGTMPVALNTNDYLIVDLFSGFGLAFIFISIIMGLLFLSVRIGLISMLPNLIPIVFAAGYLGFMGIPIRPPIAITFSICLGIAVDDSLHFLFRFWQEKKKNSNMEIAISNTIETTGLAMLTSTIVLVSGFMVITVSNFIPTSQFGIISAITLTVAFITDVTLLPALLYIFPFKRLKIKND